MGCCWSSEKSQDSAWDAGSAPMDDFDNTARKDEKSAQKDSRGSRLSIAPYKNVGPTSSTEPIPPQYTEDPESVVEILNNMKTASTMTFNNAGITGAFDILRTSDIHVWVDNNHSLKRETKDAILTNTMLLLSLGKAFSSNMEILFMGHWNLGSSKLSPAKRERATALENLWDTENWDDAVRLIEESAELKHEELQLDVWIKKFEAASEEKTDQGGSTSKSFNQSSNQPCGTEASTSKAVGSSMTSKSAETNMIEVMKDDEKHSRLLARVRELKTLYWYGWRLQDLEVNDFEILFKEAIQVARKQPKNRNHVRFTVDREMALERRLHKEREARPTSVIIQTGSKLGKKEENALREAQREVVGGGSEFSIQIALFYMNLDAETRRNYAKLDDNISGDKDICDVTEIHEMNFIARTSSPKLWVKLLNSHSRAIDNWKFKNENEKYGTQILASPGCLPILPSVEHIREVLGLNGDY